MVDQSTSYDCEIRVAQRLGSVVASALGDATASTSGPRVRLRIVSDTPLSLARLAGRLDALGLVMDDIRVTRPDSIHPSRPT